VVLRDKTARAAILGFVLFWSGSGWAVLHEYLLKRKDPPGWIMDREFYPPGAFLARLGWLLFLIATVMAIGRIAYWGVSKLRSRPHAPSTNI